MNILLVSSGGCLKMEVVCLFRTVSIPDDLVSVWKDTISMLFELKVVINAVKYKLIF
jgi:hypothetical protein